MRAACWLVLWLLSPSRGALVPKCIFIGLVLKALSFLVVVPAAWLAARGAGPVGKGPGPVISGRLVAEAVLLGPFLETLLMAAIFGILGRLLNLRAAIPGLVVVLGAIPLHEHEVVTGVLVAFMFTAFSIQYVRFRKFVPVNTAILGVTLTHGTVNLASLLVALAA